jgi:thioredoxin-related protein
LRTGKKKKDLGGNVKCYYVKNLNEDVVTNDMLKEEFIKYVPFFQLKIFKSTAVLCFEDDKFSAVSFSSLSDKYEMFPGKYIWLFSVNPILPSIPLVFVSFLFILPHSFSSPRLKISEK